MGNLSEEDRVVCGAMVLLLSHKCLTLLSRSPRKDDPNVEFRDRGMHFDDLCRGIRDPSIFPVFVYLSAGIWIS